MTTLSLDDFAEHLEVKGQKIAARFIDCHHNCTGSSSKAVVLMAMVAALASCAKADGARRAGVVAALEAAFDDIEKGEGSGRNSAIRQ